ncbi:hypothetical protein F383_18013 [Gossypium arboreum]|uniref:Uncharacterized protein n=1 Tax=Gossypium arboreum TaxID=29729 RepID=A0A0B0NQ19_GOSAR|nr:hypothetical protein F383_18013 [Gossypium arboreum]
MNLNSDVGRIPHRKANRRGDAKLALNRENHEKSRGTFLGWSLSLYSMLVWVGRWLRVLGAWINSSRQSGLRSFASVAEAEEVSSGQKVGCLQLFEITDRKKDGSPITSEAGEIMEKLKEKKAEYEAIASTNSSVNLENIDNRIITEFLGPERYGQIAQMQANMVEQITEVQRKYEELQQKLRAEAAAREAEAAAMAAEQSRVEQKVQ